MKDRLLTILDRLPIELTLSVIFFANILDAVLTIHWIDTGIATEANPIMEYFLQFGFAWFLVGKISIVSFACLTLWKLRENRLSKAVTILGCVVYCAIITFHLVGAYSLGLRAL